VPYDTFGAKAHSVLHSLVILKLEGLTTDRESEYRVIRSMLVPKRDEMRISWRKLHEELQHLYSSLNIIRKITSSGMNGAGNVEQ
jgi:hypothetical protein